LLVISGISLFPLVMIAVEPVVAGVKLPLLNSAARLTRHNSNVTCPTNVVLPQPELPNVSPACAEFIAGGVAEFTKVSVIYPLDLVRNRMSCSSPGLYSSMGDCFVKTVQGEGIAGLYKGILATYCSNIGKGTLGFGLYGCALSHFNERSNIEQDMRDPWQSVVSASLVAAVGCSVFECPLEIMAIQLQTQHAHGAEGQLAASGENFSCALHQVNASRRATYATELRYGHEGVVDTFKSIVRNRTFYLGVGPLLLRNLMWYTATFGTFEQTKAFAARTQFGDDSKTSQNRLGIGSKILCGGTSGVISWSTSFPLEVIKANMMGQPLESRHRNFESAFMCARHLYSEGGIPRLYRGLTPTLVRAIPAYTIVLNTYDFMRQRLGCQ